MNQPLPRYVDYMYSYPHKTAYRSFPSPVSLVPYLKQVEGQKASLYFHIPFCSHKCGYCNLFSLQTNRADYIATYLETLHKQAQQLSPLTTGLAFDSFAIGGGTPLLLTVPQLEYLLDTAALFGVHPSHTFTSVETSPEYADPARLDLLKQAGVARVSIGVQSFLDEELTALKRRPRRDMINQALEAIRKRQFPFFNIDLIYGIKGQTVASFLYSLEQALLFQPNELFIYPLYVRPGTAITERESDDVCFQMYCAACDLLKDRGFLQTSMRRFIHHPSADAEISCGDEVMLSCGSGGRSYLGNLHYATRYTVCQRCIAGKLKEGIPTQSFVGKLRPGDIRYRDVNGDGKVDVFDKSPIGGTKDPEIVYGFGLNMKYKNLDFGALFQGIGRSWNILGSSIIPGANRGVTGNMFTNANDRWTVDNPSQNVFYPRLDDGINSNNNQSSTWWLRNMSFLRLKNIELGYSLPKNLWRNTTVISGIRLFVRGTNLLTFSKFDLWDPEVENTTGAAYPIMKSLSAGFEIKF